ncbi:hypothetical protein ACFPL7_05625 [Dongia soli]|uniref:Uncharacterized protein n=1 Tax=Dongia soli TaxID=600628 RepID=A0ABU5EFJ9_9PROT|nr:hypothetical protein [Dongia soli]MDY0884880.1 hypothetical protein [Dongia soli]
MATNYTADSRSAEARTYTRQSHESAVSAVSWGAIIAGGVVAAALGLILISLGTGLGLVAVSPWRNEGVEGSTLGIGAIVWSIIIEIVAFGVGGYVAGRLRTKWADIHGDEVYFRDTAHGFVTWALGTLIGVALVASAAGQIARGVAETGASALGGAGSAAVMAAGGVAGSQMGNQGARGGQGSNPVDYFVDMMLRGQPAGAGGQPAAGQTNGQPGQPAGAPPQDLNNPGTRAELRRIVMMSFANGEISQPDKTYLAQVVAARTGMSQQDAEKRVDDVIGQAKAAMDKAEQKAREAADTARKAGAALAFWSFLAMLIGAFAASFAATWGGKARDR